MYIFFVKVWIVSKNANTKIELTKDELESGVEIEDRIIKHIMSLM